MIAEKEAVLRTRLRNLVAVVSNGTAVLGLGHWSGRRKTRNGRKGVLQKFADIDVFDIELNAKSRRRDPGLRDARAYLWRINLEDIKAPECFTLRRVEKAQRFRFSRRSTRDRGHQRCGILNALSW